MARVQALELEATRVDGRMSSLEVSTQRLNAALEAHLRAADERRKAEAARHEEAIRVATKREIQLEHMQVALDRNTKELHALNAAMHENELKRAQKRAAAALTWREYVERDLTFFLKVAAVFSLVFGVVAWIVGLDTILKGFSG